MSAGQDVWMRCRDGTRLLARLWSPAGEGPWPVLLMRQPYGRAIASTVTYAHPAWYASHGFLVVVQDVRGRGDSEGHFGGFAQEASDGADAVRWARRLPGSNGRLGTYGFSYQGVSQVLIGAGEAMAENAPAGDGAGDRGAGPADGAQPDPPLDPLLDPLPDCLAPAMAGLDERLHWACDGGGGAHSWALGVGWALQLAAEGCRRRGDDAGWREIRGSLGSGRWLEEGPALLERLDPEGMGAGWLRLNPAQPGPWRRHRPAAALLRRPMLLIGGWHDPQLRGVLDLWRTARAAGGRPLLRLGAWTHLDWNGGVDALQLAFFRHQLMDEPWREPELAVEWEGSGGRAGGWRAVQPTWLEQAAAGAGWRLASGGLAAVRADEGRLLPGPPAAAGASGEAAAVVFVHDPWRPVPGRGGHLGLEPGPVERGDLDRRADVACFSGDPCPQPLELRGTPRLRLRAWCDQEGFDLCAALSLVSADGTRVRQLSSGTGRWLGADAGRPALRRLELQPLAARLEPGEHLRLSLAGAAWPQVAVNPGDGSPPAGGSGPGHRPITITLDPVGSHLWLDPLIGAN